MASSALKLLFCALALILHNRAHAQVVLNLANTEVSAKDFECTIKVKNFLDYMNDIRPSKESDSQVKYKREVELNVKLIFVGNGRMSAMLVCQRAGDSLAGRRFKSIDFLDIFSIKNNYETRMDSVAHELGNRLYHDRNRYMFVDKKLVDSLTYLELIGEPPALSGIEHKRKLSQILPFAPTANSPRFYVRLSETQELYEVNLVNIFSIEQERRKTKVRHLYSFSQSLNDLRTLGAIQFTPVRFPYPPTQIGDRSDSAFVDSFFYNLIANEVFFNVIGFDCKEPYEGYQMWKDGLILDSANSTAKLIKVLTLSYYSYFEQNSLRAGRYPFWKRRTRCGGVAAELQYRQFQNYFLLPVAPKVIRL
jgi:hypothetical protein